MKSLFQKIFRQALSLVLASVFTLSSISSAYAEEQSLNIQNQAFTVLAEERGNDYSGMRDELTARAQALAASIQLAQQMSLDVPMDDVKRHQQIAQDHFKQFNAYANANQAEKARREYTLARGSFAMAHGMSLPSRSVEAREIWLDRGTIVGTKDEKGMIALIDRIHSAGFKVVKFEYNNGSYAMSSASEYLPRYPQLAAGYDPLAIAVREAHKHGMELHIWFRVFVSGNRGLNPILGKPSNYPGPIIEKNPDWALRAKNGSPFPPQADSETWISPANKPGCEFITNVAREVIRKYDVDGFQIDYIRFPFQKNGTEVGYDKESRQSFEKSTGLNLDNLDDKTRRAWQAWKTSKVSKFVQDLSFTLQRDKPGLVVSGAIYGIISGGKRELRLNVIQQDWESWTTNGWVDNLNPMTYDESLWGFITNAGYVKQSTSENCLVYPAIPFFRIDDGVGVIDRVVESRKLGTLGTIGFATAQLDEEKFRYLKHGPYRKPALMTPHKLPVKASQVMFDEFASNIYKCSGGVCKAVLATEAEDGKILAQVEDVRQSLMQVNDQSKSSDIEALVPKVVSLQDSMRQWLSLEPMVKRNDRVEFLVDSLRDVKAVLIYAIQKAKLKEQLTPQEVQRPTPVEPTQVETLQPEETQE